MADSQPSRLPRLTAEQRRVAAGQFERANQVLATGNFDYAIQLLLTCCKLDPGTLAYRQTLRQTVKKKYKNNLRGSAMAKVTTLPLKLKLRKALGGDDHLHVLELAEQILTYNPWDTSAQLAMAQAFDGLELLDPAVWTLEQARQKDPKDLGVNRALAKIYEKRGNFTQAINLWEVVRKADPSDLEAQHKSKDLAASATIARGKYEEAIQGKPADRAAGKATTETVADGPSMEQTQPSMPSADRHGKEVAVLEERLASEPTDAGLYLQLANLLRRDDQLDKARLVLERGLGPTGNSFDLVTALSDLEAEIFRRNLAVAEEKLKAKPGDQDLQKIRIKLAREVNARELALFRMKAERYPTEKSHCFEMGVRLLKGGQVDEAIHELQTARSDPRFQGKALYYLGYCFKNRHNWRLAQRNFEEALQHLPASEDSLRKEILFQLAKGCADAGELAKAVELAYELANLDFSYRDIGRLLDEWQARLQNA